MEHAPRVDALRSSSIIRSCGQVAQSVEQWTENPRVGSSILPLATSNPRQQSVCFQSACCGGLAGILAPRALRSSPVKLVQRCARFPYA